MGSFCDKVCGDPSRVPHVSILRHGKVPGFATPSGTIICPIFAATRQLTPNLCPLNCRLILQFPHTIQLTSLRPEADKMKTLRNITVADSDDLYR